MLKQKPILKICSVDGIDFPKQALRYQFLYRQDDGEKAIDKVDCGFSIMSVSERNKRARLS